MTIAEVSKKYEISADTLRYYERIGLIPRVNRNASGNRDYTETDCNWVSFIKCMRKAGLSIEALIEYVALFQQGEKTHEARKSLLKEQRQILENQITEMQDTLQFLNQKIDKYDELLVSYEDRYLKGKE